MLLNEEIHNRLSVGEKQRLAKLASEMALKLNKRAGNLGLGNINGLKSPSGESYDYLYFLTNTVEEIMPLWEKWIDNYCAAKQFCIPAGGTLLMGKKLIVYWLDLPSIQLVPCNSKIGAVKYLTTALVVVSTETNTSSYVAMDRDAIDTIPRYTVGGEEYLEKN